MLEAGGQRQPDKLGGARDIGGEQLVVGQHMVHVGGRMDDQVDVAGKPGEFLLRKPEVRHAKVARQHFEVLAGEASETGYQRRIRVECRLDAPASVRVILAARNAHDLAAAFRHALQPGHHLEATEETGDTGNQHGPGLVRGRGQ